MNFFKKMLGISADLKSQAQSIKIQGTLYRVIKDARNIMFASCTIGFENNNDEYSIRFIKPGSGEQQQQEYAFPVHSQMNLVSFKMNKGGKMNACFEWNLDETGQHIGCYMDPIDQDKFKDVICKILKAIMNDQNIKDHLKLCKELTGIPIYKDTQSSNLSAASSKSSGIKQSDEMSKAILRQAGKDQNRMVHSAVYYEHFNGQKKIINDCVIFVVKETGKFLFEIQVLSASGYVILKKQLSHSLIYEINTEQAYIKWLQKVQGYQVVEIGFEGKRDAAMSLKFAVTQCLYEANTKKKLTDAVAEDQITYLKRISDKPEKMNQKIVKTYEDEKEQLQMSEAKFVYENKDVGKGLQKYRVLCQGKISNFDIASLGNMLETLKIQEDNVIKQVDKKKIDYNIDSIYLHENDKKALLNDENGRLHYYDLGEGKIVQSYDFAPKGIQDFCPEYKLAETSEYKTFKAVSPNTIYEVDPRTKEGVASNKTYATNPEFNKISVDCKGKFACGSANGEIRLYDKIGKNSNCKYPGFGDPVLHLESTKDGKWLLATFKSYLILLPTHTENDVSLYEQKIKIIDRPSPIRLRIKMEHLQICKITDVEMVPAKFDERKGGKQMFIVSGFGEYVAIWNLAHVIRGQVNNYKFMKIDGELVQAEFMFDNVKKLLMTTKSGIVIKENKLRT